MSYNDHAYCEIDNCSTTRGSAEYMSNDDYTEDDDCNANCDGDRDDDCDDDVNDDCEDDFDDSPNNRCGLPPLTSWKARPSELDDTYWLKLKEVFFSSSMLFSVLIIMIIFDPIIFPFFKLKRFTRKLTTST